jgi:hypothetical protein
VVIPKAIGALVSQRMAFNKFQRTYESALLMAISAHG